MWPLRCYDVAAEMLLFIYLSGNSMFDAARCQELAIEYKALARLSDVSVDRAILQKNIARTLTGLASQLDRLAALTREEAQRLGAGPSERRSAPSPSG